MKKRIFSILIATVMAVSLCLVPAVASAADPYGAELTLENKDPSTWAVIEDDTGGLLEYDLSGPEFNFRFTATGLDTETEYSLIYYADKYPDRFANWGGDNPGAVIATFTSDSAGDISGSGSVELNMSLPCPPDANIDKYDYTLPPDEYTHAHGAKIWLVPTDCLTGSNLPVKTWSPARFLFETDLITYTDTGSVVNLGAETPQIIAILVMPTSIDFGTVMPGQNKLGPNIDVKNVGTVTVDVDAELDPLSGTIFNYLKLGGSYPTAGEWTDIFPNSLEPSITKSKTTALDVPSTYSARGSETATLIFWATAAP